MQQINLFFKGKTKLITGFELVPYWSEASPSTPRLPFKGSTKLVILWLTVSEKISSHLKARNYRERWNILIYIIYPNSKSLYTQQIIKTCARIKKYNEFENRFNIYVHSKTI